ncbi:hypothetical protein [Actinomycetospora cinnamomea]|uniref:Uncharacterized protein n=1 Tax=Actinomycetospora cinnamomea TaxID=663609 RepID=A0A2U1F4J2_9PSEU|nr:hypothetical protein [Actinomycetospora cinnamomea]PVZ06950.1 hypothetical protein C8D89_112143 [Actinomycetospora cinnamomea]
MGTGLDSFSNPQDIGALYPFVGSEVLLVVVGIVLWLAWHVRQIVIENQEYRRALELYQRVGMSRVLQQGGTESLADEQALATSGSSDTGPSAGSESATGATASPTGSRHSATSDAGGPGRPESAAH